MEQRTKRKAFLKCVEQTKTTVSDLRRPDHPDLVSTLTDEQRRQRMRLRRLKRLNGGSIPIRVPKKSKHFSEFQEIDMDIKDALKIIGVKSQSSLTQIKKAYVSCLLQAHPDKKQQTSSSSNNNTPELIKCAYQTILKHKNATQQQPNPKEEKVQ